MIQTAEGVEHVLALEVEGRGALVAAQQVAALLTRVAAVVVHELRVTPVLTPVPEPRASRRRRALRGRHQALYLLQYTGYSERGC